jgi:hypothetical protein
MNGRTETCAPRCSRAVDGARFVGVATVRIAIVALILAATFHAIDPSIGFENWAIGFFALNAVVGTGARLRRLTRRDGRGVKSPPS